MGKSEIIHCNERRVDMTRTKGLILLTLLSIFIGCAGLDTEPVTTVEKDAEVRGFRYYRTAPFLLVYTDNTGGLISKVYYLPDMTKKMSLKPYNYLSKNDATLTFDKGRLTQAKAVVDETVVPSAVISGLETVATSIIKAANAPAKAEKQEVPSPYLFRILKKDGKWMLSGGQALDKNGNVINVRVNAVQ
jgi:hypothetical protein